MRGFEDLKASLQRFRGGDGGAPPPPPALLPPAAGKGSPLWSL